MGGELLAAEWVKVRSVRSTWLSVAAAAVLVAGVGYAVASGTASGWGSMSAEARARFDPVSEPLFGGVFAQVVMGTLGVLAVSSEYTTGLIRTSVAATPQRWRLLAAKAAVLGGFALVVGAVLLGGTFWVDQAVLSPGSGGVSLADPGVFRAVSYSVLYMVIVTLLGVGVGAVVRHSSGAVAVLFAVVFGVPQVLDHLPPRWHDDLARFGLERAAVGAVAVRPAPGVLFSPTVSLLVCAGYAVVALAAAFVLFERRDV